MRRRMQRPKVDLPQPTPHKAQGFTTVDGEGHVRQRFDGCHFPKICRHGWEVLGDVADFNEGVLIDPSNGNGVGFIAAG